MSKQQNKVTGNKGESLAAEYLQMKGYEILGRNYQSKWGEVDIVAKCKVKSEKGEVWGQDVVVFVEVKTKTTDKYGEPWEMVNSWKVEQVKRMGEMWCREHGYAGRVRVDVVGVYLYSEDLPIGTEHQGLQVGPRIEHWESVEI